MNITFLILQIITLKSSLCSAVFCTGTCTMPWITMSQGTNQATAFCELHTKFFFPSEFPVGHDQWNSTAAYNSGKCIWITTDALNRPGDAGKNDVTRCCICQMSPLTEGRYSTDCKSQKHQENTNAVQIKPIQATYKMKNITRWSFAFQEGVWGSPSHLHGRKGIQNTLYPDIVHRSCTRCRDTSTGKLNLSVPTSPP